MISISTTPGGGNRGGGSGPTMVPDWVRYPPIPPLPRRQPPPPRPQDPNQRLAPASPPLPKPGDPLPQVQRGMTDAEKEVCWEKIVSHALIGAGTGLVGASTSIKVCPLVVPPPALPHCIIGAYVVGAMGGIVVGGLEAHADYCHPKHDEKEAK